MSENFRSRFDGRRFHNPPGPRQAGYGPLLSWLLNRDTGPWPGPPDGFRPGPSPPERADGLRVTFVNHSTVLLQVGGMNLLTDPIWADRASPLPFAGPRRAHPPGIRFEDLPPIDAVLLSHDHYDHCCLPTLRRLRDRDRPAVVTGLGNARLLRRNGLDPVTELDWWQETGVGDGMRLTFVPARHFSGRGPLNRNATLWGGFHVRADGRSLLFVGDTGAGPHFRAIRERLGAPDLALVPIGAFRPRAIMAAVHLCPEEAVEAHVELGARLSVGIHFGTFPLADDGQWEAPRELERALAAAGIDPDAFRVPGFGEAFDIP